MKKYLRSGDVARKAGVSTDTLRHYERLGLIARPGRSANGYREYAPDTLDRVRLIQSALGLGFTLQEVARILRSRDRGIVPCREVRELASQKLQQIEARIRGLLLDRDQFRKLLEDWDARLKQMPPGERLG